MGLHLCYELSLPPDRPETEVAERLESLRQRALALPFDRVSSLLRFDERALAEERPPHGLAFESLAHLAHFTARIRRDALYREWLGLDEDAGYEVVDEPTRRYRPIEAPPEVPSVTLGFAVVPGDRSEAATFVLTRLRGAEVSTRWWDHCCCKTQYASVLGDEHLLRCHGSLVTLLDAARELGLDVVVRDETGYWDSRDPAQLVAAVAEMNRVVARFAGAFTDAMRDAGGDSRGVQGAIFEHPDFERLEGGGAGGTPT